MEKSSILLGNIPHNLVIITMHQHDNLIFHCIIPLYNSLHFSLQINAFSRLQIPDDSISIRYIFVDDGSEKQYREIYEKELIRFREKNDASYLYLGEKPNPSCNRVNKARNTGAMSISDGFLVFFDQETIPASDYFMELIAYLNDTEVFIGPSLGYNNQEKKIDTQTIDDFIDKGSISLPDSYEDFRTKFIQDKERSGRLWEFFGASNVVMPVSVFREIGGFDEILTGWGDEDVELGYRIHLLGYKITFCSKIAVLNLSEKLYRSPYHFLEYSRIKELTTQFTHNYQKHTTPEYKRHVLDRFSHFSLDEKKQVSADFEKNILLHRLYSETSAGIVFFRIDDVKEITPDFLKLSQIFSRFQIPCILAVEPGNISDATVKYLLREKEKDPCVFDIVQHGWKHTNHSGGGPWKYEFGEAYSLEKKHEDINRGYQKMKELFGNSFFEAFVPPYNFTDYESQEILGDLGFKVFSSGFPRPYLLSESSAISIPALVDIIAEYHPLQYKTFREIVQEIDYYESRDGYVSCILHPQYFSQDTLLLLGQILFYIKKKGYRTIKFSDFYSQYSFQSHEA